MVEFSPGSIFAGHRIEAIAGRGGMGVVYRASQLDLGRTVALKVIAPELAEDPRLRDRFVNESRVAASIDHPNVIPIFYTGEEQNVLFIVMRYVVGTDLRRLVRAEGRLDAHRALRVLEQVAEALDAAHERGLVHRDVKPANVLLTGHDHAYLTDFGLTRRMASISEATQSGAWVGTLDYAAPEQIRGERVDARADIYALGCLLFFALAGEVPYPRDSDEAKLWAHLSEPAPSLADRVDDGSARLDSVIARALSKRPEDRFPSAGDVARAAFAAALDRPLSEPERTVAEGSAAPWEGSTISGRGPARPTEALTALLPGDRTPWMRAQARLLGWGVGVLLVALVSVTVALSSRDDPAPPPASPTPTATASPAPGTGRPAAARLVATVPVGERPNAIALAGRAVWVTSFRGQSVTRIDSRTGRVRDARLVVGAGATDVAAGYGSIWVTNSRTNSLIRADDGTGKPIGSPIALPQSPVLVTTGEGAVWVAGRPPLGTPATSTIFRIDPRRAQIVDSIPVTDRLRSIAVGRGAVWALTGRALLRISLSSAQQSRVGGVGLDPKHVAVGAGAVWVTNAGEDTVTRVAIPSAKVTNIPVGAAPSHVAVHGRNVWVTNFEDHTLRRIDARTLEVSWRPTRVRRNPFALAVGDRRVWVTSVVDNAVTKMSYR